MSDRVERKLLGMLADPRESPYGNPIPGLEELGGPKAQDASFRDGLLALSEAVTGTEPRDVVVRRLGEPLQTETGLMEELARLGVRPGSAVRAWRADRGVRVHTPFGEVDVPSSAAHHVFVAPTGVS